MWQTLLPRCRTSLITPGHTHKMPAEEQLDEFLGALEALHGHSGNGKLRELLGWDEASYDAVKAELVSRRIVVPGRGKGGSVPLVGELGVVCQ